MILTPENYRWPEFLDRLAGPEGCNFRYLKDGSADQTWDCACGHDKSKATAIMTKMNETLPPDQQIDIPKTLEYFDNHGGYCDCEITFNVEQGEPE